jgi:hypothetical protein
MSSSSIAWNIPPKISAPKRRLADRVWGRAVFDFVAAEYETQRHRRAIERHQEGDRQRTSGKADRPVGNRSGTANQRPCAILMMSLVGVETSSADDLSEARIASSTK